MTDAWELVRREREALVEDLAGLTDEQWELPSLCGGVDGPRRRRTPRRQRPHHPARHRGRDGARTLRLRPAERRRRRREKGATPAETLDRLRAVVGRRMTSSLALTLTAGSSRLFHVRGAERRPLHVRRDYPTETVERALADELRHAGRAGRRQAAPAGLRLVATTPTGPTARAPRSRSAGVAADGRLGPGRGLEDLAGPGCVDRLTGALTRCRARSTAWGRGRPHAEHTARGRAADRADRQSGGGAADREVVVESPEPLLAWQGTFRRSTRFRRDDIADGEVADHLLVVTGFFFFGPAGPGVAAARSSLPRPAGRARWPRERSPTRRSSTGRCSPGSRGCWSGPRRTSPGHGAPP